jgi:hypothetical protein
VGATGPRGAERFDQNTDAISANLTIDQIAYPAITALNVTNNGSTSYRFVNHYSTADNPTIYVISGLTIAFSLDCAGFPFVIQTTGGSNFNSGLIHVATNGVISTGASAQGKDFGTLYWQIPVNVTGNYRYQCGTIPVMSGTINIKDIVSI